jgi:hypothetical protein
MKPVSDMPFSLQSFWGAESFSLTPIAWSPKITVTGQFVGGGSTTQTFALDLINDGRGGLTEILRQGAGSAGAGVVS